MPSILLKISAVLWVIWGFVHLMAGVMIIPSDTTTGIQSIAAGVDPALLEMDYHEAVGAILNQHAWNLAWVGVTTVVAAYFIWKANRYAVFLAALVGGLVDVGYFVFIDLGGYGTFFPGSSMTYVSGSAIILSFFALYQDRKSASAV